MPRIVALFALLACVPAWFALAPRSHEPESLPAPVDPAGRWKETLKLGSVSGTLKFAAPRPKQPIVVYLARESVPAFEPPPPLFVSQKGARFDPSFAVVVVGQTVTFSNDEDKEIDHNVYFLGADKGDLGIFPKSKSVNYTFKSPGEVSMYCSVHKLMDGKLFVAPAPVYAELDGETPTFSIRDVPVGTWTLKTWQKARRFKDAEMKVEVKEGDNKVDVEMTR